MFVLALAQFVTVTTRWWLLAILRCFYAQGERHRNTQSEHILQAKQCRPATSLHRLPTRKIKPLPKHQGPKGYEDMVGGSKAAGWVRAETPAGSGTVSVMWIQPYGRMRLVQRAAG